MPVKVDVSVDANRVTPGPTGTPTILASHPRTSPLLTGNFFGNLISTFVSSIRAPVLWPLDASILHLIGWTMSVPLLPSRRVAGVFPIRLVGLCSPIALC